MEPKELEQLAYEIFAESIRKNIDDGMMVGENHLPPWKMLAAPIQIAWGDVTKFISRNSQPMGG